MPVDKIKQLHKLRDEDPEAALAYLTQLGNTSAEQIAAAVVLVDSGDALEDISSISQGIEILERLSTTSKPHPEILYNLANGLQIRSRLQAGQLPPTAEQAFEDRFKARVHFGSVIRNNASTNELKSQALTNIGILLLETSRWVEALDCFQKALFILPRNGVAAYQEMRHLMQLAHLFCMKQELYQSYCNIGSLLRRIKFLSGVIAANYDTVLQFAGKEALPTVKKAVVDAQKIEAADREPIDNPYFAFIDARGLALSLHCSNQEYSAGRFDLLAIPSIRTKISDGHEVPEIFAMINVMKSDFAFARQVYFDVHDFDTETQFFETTSHSDTLDYAVYGVRFSALTSAQRIAFDILDKIAVALACYLKMKKAYGTSFSTVWGKVEKGSRFTLYDEIVQPLHSGNPGLSALYDIFHDISKDDSRGHGFLEAHKSYRNCSTHRFSVLHDDFLTDDQSSPSRAIDHAHLQRFETLTFDSLKLARAAIFYFVDMINFSEESNQTDIAEIVVSSTVPDHSYVRGRS